MAQECAYITGGASGIAREMARMLVKHNIKVFIVDRNLAGAQQVVDELSQTGAAASCAHVDVADWDSQATAFSQAVAEFGRIDYVYPIAGINERAWIPPEAPPSGFARPDLSVLDVDLTGALYTMALAVQQFRKQEPNQHGFRGKMVCVASVCGFYCVPSLPVYTAAKHGVVGFVRSYGKYLPREQVTCNAVCPHVVRTNISSQAFYDNMDAAHLLTPIDAVVAVFEELLGPADTSGECFEVGPNAPTTGAVPRKPAAYLDDASATACDMLAERSLGLHTRR